MSLKRIRRVQSCADEVSALVLDIGTSSIRAGYAGDDTPKAIIPTSYGYTEEPSDDQDVNMEADGDKENEGVKTENGDSTPRKKVKLHIGQSGPSLFRPHMEVRNPMKGGLSEYDTCTVVKRSDAKLHSSSSQRLYTHSCFDSQRTC